jgi:hypothetical protein
VIPEQDHKEQAQSYRNIESAADMAASAEKRPPSVPSGVQREIRRRYRDIVLRGRRLSHEDDSREFYAPSGGNGNCIQGCSWTSYLCACAGGIWPSKTNLGPGSFTTNSGLP